MTNLFVLFALFTVGSATDAVDCSNKANFDNPCVKNNLVGKCHTSDGACLTDSAVCTSKEKNEVCGSGDAVGMCEDGGADKKCFYTATCTDKGAYCANGTHIGICSVPGKCNTRKPCYGKSAGAACGASGKCDGGYCVMETKNVAIQYSVNVPDGDRLKFYAKLAEAEYDDASLACHPVEDRGVSNGSLKTSGNGECDKSHFVNGEQCKLTCVGSGFVEKTKHTRKCNADGVWTGVKGECAKQCTGLGAVQGHYSYDSGTKVAQFLPAHTTSPDHGTLTCYDTFEGGAPCTLTCADNYRVKTPSGYKCQDGTTWTGVQGECEASTDISASAGLALQPGEVLSDVIAKRDEAFNKRFMDSVSALLGSPILSANVKIVGIKTVAGDRRLNESSVHVDYTLRVPKGDPEGATELVKIDGTQSPEVGGVLRGIR